MSTIMQTDPHPVNFNRNDDILSIKERGRFVSKANVILTSYLHMQMVTLTLFLALKRNLCYLQHSFHCLMNKNNKINI